MIKLTKKQKEELRRDFKNGYDYSGLNTLVDILEAKKEDSALLNFVKYFLQGYYIHEVDNDQLTIDAYDKNWANYICIRDFVLDVYKIGGIIE
jgi:hypothetical protein